MTATAITIDPAVCPLCGQANTCGMAAGNAGVCWCVGETFPSALLAQLPQPARGKACVCYECVRRFELEAAAGSGGDARP
jgi:hypothetical protein